MSVALPVAELWRENFRNGAGGRSTDSSKALISKIVEHLMLSSELKTGCGSNFRFRSYGGKIFPGWRKQVETDSSKAVMS